MPDASDHIAAIANGLADPTKNVLIYVDKAVKRIDDLSLAETRRINETIVLEHTRINDIMDLRSEYDGKLMFAEAKRIDAIRTVDVQAVTVASDRAAAQALVLANQVSASAETLRALVATTATSVATQLAQISTQLSDRISSLEKSQYQISGSVGGRKDVLGYIVGAIGLAIAVGSFLLPHLR